MILSSEKISKKFGKLIAINNISFDVNKEEVVVIIGPSGSGKTTLLRCINGLEMIDSGKITIDGVVLNKSTVSEIRKEIGMVFQKFNLFPHLTVMENICLAQQRVKKRDKKTAKSIALNLLKKIGLESKIDACPEELSGGQQQRVAIVRALALQPKLMLFDEPTSALDPEMTKEVLEVMKSLAKEGITMIVVSHEMGFVREVANKIIFLDHGKVVEQGHPEQIFDSPLHKRTEKFISRIIEFNRAKGGPRRL